MFQRLTNRQRPRIESSDSEEDDSDTPLAKKRSIIKEEVRESLFNPSVCTQLTSDVEDAAITLEEYLAK